MRTAARRRKKEKVTALLHHVTVELLRFAYTALKRDAAAGVDGVTWTPSLPWRDEHDVYARWTANSYRSTAAPYTVFHEGGSTNRREEPAERRIVAAARRRASRRSSPPGGFGRAPA
jgi:hypothetical protein